MPDLKPAFVFVHGGWIDNSIWRLVIPLLEARGHVARALDLPGSAAPAGFSDVNAVLSHAARDAVVKGYATTAGFAQVRVNR